MESVQEASAVVFGASSGVGVRAILSLVESPFVTGAVVQVDGGLTHSSL